MSVPRAERPGLQAERTSLAWDRTALGLLGNGALLLLPGITPQRPAAGLAAGAALLLSLTCALIGRRRARQVRSLRSGSTPPASREVALLGGGVIALGLLVVVLAAS